MPSNKDQVKPRTFSGIPLYVRRAIYNNVYKGLQTLLGSKNTSHNLHFFKNNTSN